MSPKKKVKTETAVDGATPAPQALIKIDTTINEKYFTVIQDALNVIFGKWPNIVSLDPLPESGVGGHEQMQGFMAPFNVFAYDAQRQELEMEYHTAINFFWQNILLSPMPWVPIQLDQVQQYADGIKPGMLKHSLVVCADFQHGAGLPRGGLVRVSPDEFPHAVVLKIAGLIRKGATDDELKPYKRMVLSTPATFVRHDLSHRSCSA